MTKETYLPSQIIFGRELKAATVAYQLGISLAYCKRAYVLKDSPVEDFWITLGTQISNSWMVFRDEHLRKLMSDLHLARVGPPAEGDVKVQ